MKRLCFKNPYTYDALMWFSTYALIKEQSHAHRIELLLFKCKYIIIQKGFIVNPLVQKLEEKNDEILRGSLAGSDGRVTQKTWWGG